MNEEKNIGLENQQVDVLEQNIKKSLDQIYKQVHQNSKNNREQILQLLKTISGNINDPTMLQLLSGSLTDFMKALINNDQLLVKLSSSMVGYLKTKKKYNDKQQIEQLLSDEEKKQLLVKYEQNRKQSQQILDESIKIYEERIGINKK